MRIVRRLALGGAACLLLLLGFVAITARSGDPALFPAGEDGIEIVLVSNGYHAGLALPRQAVGDWAGEEGLASLLSVNARFRHYRWFEVGWGDADFYRSTPTADAFQWRLAARALSGLGGGSVLHIVGFDNEPEQVFHKAQHVRIRLSQVGFTRLVRRLDESFAVDGSGRPEELGPGLYGPSLFYRATGHFNLFRVCNHWIADLLDAAGIPTTPALALLPLGIIADLRLRSGL